MNQTPAREQVAVDGGGYADCYRFDGESMIYDIQDGDQTFRMEQQH